MGIGALRRHHGGSDADNYLGTDGSPRRGESDEAVTESAQVVVPNEQPRGADPEVKDEHVTEVTPVTEAVSETAEDEAPAPAKATRSRK